MKNLFRTNPPSSILVAVAFALFCFGMLIASGGQPSQQSPVRAQLKIINKTKSIEVVEVRAEDPNFFIIVLKNVSVEDINGFEINVQHHARIKGDTSVGGWVIPPGATHELAIPVRYALSEIEILAAMFADGNIEGDPTAVKHLKQWRSELQKHLLRLLPLLERALESPDVNSLEALDRLESQISSLSSNPETQPGMTSGFEDAKSDLLTELRALRQRLERNGVQNQQKRLFELKNRIEKRIANL
ncbi:MAG TPA: hypothetical protein VJU84_08950 [Pyrinomonadaceae bacterium]|nr:hypothetical protein [Pyrinomonadaceae bacterium]